VCLGTNVQGQLCNDGNLETINDVYFNGVCLGTSVPNGTICNDNNSNTINDIYTNGICTGTVTQLTCKIKFNNDNTEYNMNIIKPEFVAYASGLGPICGGTLVAVFDKNNCNYTKFMETKCNRVLWEGVVKPGENLIIGTAIHYNFKMFLIFF